MQDLNCDRFSTSVHTWRSHRSLACPLDTLSKRKERRLHSSCRRTASAAFKTMSLKEFRICSILALKGFKEGSLRSGHQPPEPKPITWALNRNMSSAKPCHVKARARKRSSAPPWTWSVPHEPAYLQTDLSTRA